MQLFRHEDKERNNAHHSDDSGDTFTTSLRSVTWVGGGRVIERWRCDRRMNAHVEVSILGGEKMSHFLFREDRLKMSIYSCDSLK